MFNIRSVSIKNTSMKPSFILHQRCVCGTNKGKPFEEIPGPHSHSIFGTLPKYLPLIGEYSAEALHKNAFTNYRKYGPIVRERLLPSVSLLHLFDPEDMETVFRSEGRLPERRSHLAMLQYRTRKPQVYNTGGLLATNGPEWWRLRSAFQKNFTRPQSVRNYVARTDAVVRNFIDWVGCEPQKHSVDFLPSLNKLYLEVICRIVFDESLESFSEEEQASTSRTSLLIEAAFNSNRDIFKLDQGVLWKHFNTPKYTKLVKAQDYLEGFARQMLLKRVRFFERDAASEETARCLLDDFLEQPNVDLKDITGMLVDILMASVDTTSFSTSFLLYHVAENRKVQERLYEECESILADKDSPVTTDLLNRASYTKCCIKESLRLNPVSVGVGRVLQKDLLISGYLVPKGTVIVTQNMVASRLHQYVEDPVEFKPERWQRGERERAMHPFLSLPFGFGPRSCIARRLAEQNMAIALLKLVRNFRLEWAGGELGVQTKLINKPDLPVQLRFTLR